MISSMSMAHSYLMEYGKWIRGHITEEHDTHSSSTLSIHSPSLQKSEDGEKLYETQIVSCGHNIAIEIMN